MCLTYLIYFNALSHLVDVLDLLDVLDVLHLLYSLDVLDCIELVTQKPHANFCAAEDPTNLCEYCVCSVSWHKTMIKVHALFVCKLYFF